MFEQDVLITSVILGVIVFMIMFVISEIKQFKSYKKYMERKRKFK